jgi:molybdopterin-containing oxidoreductase family iron-sulfur binding subunit
MTTLNRRDFVKAVGVSGAAAVASGCSTEVSLTKLPSAVSWDPLVPVENVLPYVVQPDQIMPGLATWFATRCDECPSGCGVLAKNREGRVVKLEGNPQDPTSQGKLCSRGQAGIQATYSPDRFISPMVAGAASTWETAISTVGSALSAAKAGGQGVAWLGRYRTGSLGKLIGQLMAGAGGSARQWEPLGRDSLRSATKAVFGMDAIPSFRLDEARTIVSFGADFLGTWGETLQLTRGYANARDPKMGGFVTRLVCVEPRVGTSAAMADLHLAAKPGSEVGVALALAGAVAKLRGYNGPAAGLLASADLAAAAAAAEISAERLAEVAKWIAEGVAVALPSGTATSGSATDLDIAVLLLNEVAGAVGKTVVFGNHANTTGRSSFAEVSSLLADCAAGKVGVLFLDDLDIVHLLPGDVKVREALEKVGTLVVFTNEPMDSLLPKAIVLPPGSTLETWGDGEGVLGRLTLQQPAMKAIHNTQSVGDSILGIAKAAGISAPAAAAPVGDAAADPAAVFASAAPVGLGLDAASFKDYVAARWMAEVWGPRQAGGTFQDFWVASLQRGGHFEDRPATGAPVVLTVAPAAGAPPSGDGKVLALFPHPYIYDGRHANKPWAQEVPEPLSSFTWGTWVEIHGDTAKDLGLEKDDGVILQTEQGEVEVGWFSPPGIRKDVIAVVMGNGHEAGGRYTRFGQNPMKLIRTGVDSGGALSFVTTVAKVKRSGKQNPVHAYAGAMTMEGRGLNFTVSIDDLGKGHGPSSIVPEHHVPVDERLTSRGLTDMYPEPEHPTYRFALAVDLNRCTGCGACESACFAENNLSVVGPDEVRKSRHMGWLRLSRYWEGGGEFPDVRFQPVMCQQCSHAPCEGVCPVLATYHNLDGLNAMIYNRCVGTRYCGNNCPYTARRFNYHTYKWPDSFNLMLNPEVSPREMGIMEKCTFCVQRIREVKDRFRDQDHAVATSESLLKLTACAQACPADALTFGNTNDKEGAVSTLFSDERAYIMLRELNTKPGVRYLARINHTPSKLHGHGHSAHGSGHDEEKSGGHAAPAHK